VPAETLRVQLRPQAIAEAVTVTADTATARLAVESSVTSIDRSAIALAPAVRLDDQLRSVPGFSLFRRTTSAVANPTTQGVTLRGVGGTHESFQATVRGGYFDEDRGNGTPGQVNATITRWSGANAHGLVGGGVWDARGDVSVNNYRQTFTAATGTVRGAERFTALQWVHSIGAGGGVTWLRQV